MYELSYLLTSTHYWHLAEYTWYVVCVCVCVLIMLSWSSDMGEISVAVGGVTAKAV